MALVLVTGASTGLGLATADPHGSNLAPGGYRFHGRPRRPHPAALDTTFQDQLLDKLKGHTGLPLN